MAAMIDSEEKGHFRFIKSNLSGYCLQAEDSSDSELPQRPVCLASIVPNKLTQLWRVNEDHRIQNAQGKFLAFSGLGKKGSSLCVSEKSDSITQQWHMTPDGELLNDNGMYLTIKGGKTTVSATLWANTRKKSPAQKWDVLDDVNLDDIKLEKLRERLSMALALAAVKTAVKNEDLSALFEQFDLDHNGTLDENEIRILVRNAMDVPESELSDLELKVFVKQIDKNGDGLIDFSEFTEFLGFQERPVEEKPSAAAAEEEEDDDDDEDDDESEEESDEEEPEPPSTIKFSNGTKKN